jgi:hypothetical protein
VKVKVKVSEMNTSAAIIFGPPPALSPKPDGDKAGWGMNGFALFTFAISFPAERPACGLEARGLRAKSIGRLNFGFRIADFGFWRFPFQSAFCNQQSAIAEARPSLEAICAS